MDARSFLANHSLQLLLLTLPVYNLSSSPCWVLALYPRSLLPCWLIQTAFPLLSLHVNPLFTLLPQQSAQVKEKFPTRPSNSTSSYLPKRHENMHPPKNLQRMCGVAISVIIIAQNQKWPKYLWKWMEKQNAVSTCSTEWHMVTNGWTWKIVCAVDRNQTQRTTYYMTPSLWKRPEKAGIQKTDQWLPKSVSFSSVSEQESE